MNYQFVPIEIWPGTPSKPQSSRFRAKHHQTIELLVTELRHLKATNVVIQAYVDASQIRNDGMLYASACPSKPGIILAFDSKHGPLSYPCDCYNDWKDNLRAIALALQALRAVDRYGVTKRAEQYKGWARLEDKTPTGLSTVDNGVMTAGSAARFFANVSRLHREEDVLSDREAANRCYQRAAIVLHPDNTETGCVDGFKTLQRAREALVLHHRSL